MTFHLSQQECGLGHKYIYGWDSPFFYIYYFLPGSYLNIPYYLMTKYNIYKCVGIEKENGREANSAIYEVIWGYKQVLFSKLLNRKELSINSV